MSLSTVKNFPAYHYQIMKAYKNENPDPKQKTQCRFMLFVRIRPGIPSHFADRGRTGYYPGNKYTNEPAEMLVQLLRMINKEVNVKKRFDMYILFDNDKAEDEKVIFKWIDGYTDPENNRLKLYYFMMAKYQLPQWMK